MTWIRFENNSINSDHIMRISLRSFELYFYFVGGDSCCVPLTLRDKNKIFIDDPRVKRITEEIYEEIMANIIANRSYYCINDNFEKKLKEKNIEYCSIYN